MPAFKHIAHLLAEQAICVAILVVAWTAGHARATDVPLTRPEELGFSSERLASIDKFYDAKVAKGEMPGIVVLIARHGKIAHFSAIGYADTGSHKKLQEDSIFRLYSMTKPITATALMLLYEEGKFRLDDPISKYIPAFAGIRVLRTPESALADTVAAEREPTIHDLFRHTAGLMHGGARPPKTPIDNAYDQADLFNPTVSLEAMMQRLAKIPLHYQPGMKFEYSVVQDVQARLVEILSGMPFDQFLEQRLFAPLGMSDTSHWVTPAKASRLVAVHWMKNGQVVPCDTEHGCATPGFGASEIYSYLKDNAHKGGSFGLTGTAEDYWRFAQMMAEGGALNGHRLLSLGTVSYMARDHLGAAALLNNQGGSSGTGWGLGFAVVKDAAAAGSVIPDSSYYWAGAAGTFFWIDPTNDIVVVAMTQSMDPKIDGWSTQRERLAAMVYGALIN